MSTPSIKSPRSPPQRWLSNDDKTDAPRRSSENLAGGNVAPLGAVPAPIGSGELEQNEEVAPLMSYPIDENLFYSAPSQAVTTTSDVRGDEETTYPQGVAEELLPPPDFKPFFTLIEDPETGEHHHPTVHYIFSDDDPEILTNAALGALDDHGEGSQYGNLGEKAEERYVIVDMAPDGKTVASVSSLSKEWQALHTSIAQAPSWGDETKSEDRGLKLKISGQESRRRLDVKERRRSLQTVDNIESLVAAFNAKLDSLDEVLGRTGEMGIEQRGLE